MIGWANKALVVIPTSPRAHRISNLIENVFGIMVERMSSEKLDTIPKLQQAIKDTWNNLTRSDILNLYASWRDRLAAVRDAAGGPTRF
jgi:hypothetical protein